MRKIILWIAAFVFVMFSSCKKEPEKVFSCNESMNNWAITIQGNFDNISRDSLASIQSIDTQRIIYRTLSSSAKRRIWTEKLQLAKQGLTASEQAHIQLAIDHFNDEQWGSTDSLDSLGSWATIWMQDARSNYGWSEEKAFLIAETWLTESELLSFKSKIIAQLPPNNPAAPNSPPPDCDCRISLGCVWFQQSCDKISCSSVQACGLFGTSNCTGKCKSYTSSSLYDGF